MVALRCVTRQLADRALPRLQAVCTASPLKEAVQRRLLQTVASTSSGRVASSGRNTAKLPAAKPQLIDKQEERLVRTQLAQIQKKKEELFSLITQLDSKLPDRCTKVNKQLAIDLSAQVEPKPNDPQWVWYRGAKRLNTFLIYGGMTYLGYMAVSNGFQNCNIQNCATDPTEQK